MSKQKIHIAIITSLIIGAAVPACLTGCSTTDKYQNKKRLDTIKKDLDSAHKDIDWALGLDEPSSMVEEK